MVTRKCKCICYYLLHFFDLTNNNDVFETVISGNPSTIRYYANRARVSRNLLLEDFYELMMFGQYMWLTKYFVVAKEREFRFRRYYVALYDARKTFDEFLEITNQTPDPTPDRTTMQQQETPT